MKRNKKSALHEEKQKELELRSVGDVWSGEENLNMA